jgi:hypothetical protein
MNPFAHPGDAWQHAIGNVIAVLVFLFSFCWLCRHGAASVLPDGADPVVDRRLLSLFPGWKGGEMVSRHRVAVMPGHGGKPTLKELARV